MKKGITYILMLAMMAALASGCQADNTASGTPEASGRAVSGSAAMDDQEENTGKDLKWNENSDNRYELYDENRLIQCRLDGTLVKKIKLDTEEIEALQWVTDQWLYYTTCGKNMNDVLWRIPIRKTEKGDRLLTGKKERITTMSEIYFCYATDTCLILENYDDEDAGSRGLYRYDLTDQKMVRLIGDNFGSVLERDGYPFVTGDGELLVESMDMEGEEIRLLSRLNPDTGKLCEIGTYDTGACSDDWIRLGDSLFILADNNLYQYSISRKKLECAVPEKNFLKEIRKLKQNKELSGDFPDDIFMDELYLENGRLYFPVYIQWTDTDKTEKSSGKDSEYIKEELFSVSVDDLSSLRHESEIMKALEGEGKTKYKKRWDRSGNYYYSYSGWIANVSDGKIYYSCGMEEEEYIIYDLPSGEKKDVKWEELSKKEQEMLWDY